MFQIVSDSTAEYISLLRSFRNVFVSRIYKHSVPTELFRTAAMFSLLLLMACATSTIEPVALAPEDMCSYCRMAISEARYAAELVNQDGQALKFDDIGCMVNFVEYKKNTTKPAGYFVMDFDERQWIKAEDAFYVYSSELSTPMMGGGVAFKDKSKAETAAARYHGQLLRFKDLFKDQQLTR